MSFRKGDYKRPPPNSHPRRERSRKNYKDVPRVSSSDKNVEKISTKRP
jgi:hypothetical protein